MLCICIYIYIYIGNISDTTLNTSFFFLLLLYFFLFFALTVYSNSSAIKAAKIKSSLRRLFSTSPFQLHDNINLFLNAERIIRHYLLPVC